MYFRMKKSIFYTANELLLNESFLRWKLFLSKPDKDYWENILDSNSALIQEINKATIILNSVKLNNYKLSSEEKGDLLKAVQREINKKKRSKIRRLYFISASVCASIAILFIMLYALHFSKDKKVQIVETDDIIQEKTINETDIQLILADNQTIAFDNNVDIIYQNDGNIIINNDNKNTVLQKIEPAEIKLNKLLVPKGKRSFLTLQDGSKVWVNSGTVLEFPAAFNSIKREIHVDGEIYIEVARNNEKTFIVNTQDMKIEVLGTRFNITAYKEDNIQSVVLVEGKVNVDYMEEKIGLEPNDMLIIKNDVFKTEKVDVYNYISWKDGMLQFSSEPLNLILNKLSRYYDIPIFSEENIHDIKCTGKLILYDDIKDVMEIIYNTISIKYEINDNEISISKK